jgi:translation initiation factor IF-2
MSENENKKTLTLSGANLREAKETITHGHQVKQQFSHGRTNAVTVVKKRHVEPQRPASEARAPRDAEQIRNLTQQSAPTRVGMGAPVVRDMRARAEPPERKTEERPRSDMPRRDNTSSSPRRNPDENRDRPRRDMSGEARRAKPEGGSDTRRDSTSSSTGAPRRTDAPSGTNNAERENRFRALQQAQGDRPARPSFAGERSQVGRPSFQRPSFERPTTTAYSPADEQRRRTADGAAQKAAAKLVSVKGNDDDDARRGSAAKVAPPKKSTTGGGEHRRGGRITVAQAQDEKFVEGKTFSDAARRRQFQKKFRNKDVDNREKVMREVTVPETITVQELASRMSEPSGVVIKTLMKMGVMATINQVIDADTAELLATELGHKIVRVSENDVEIGLGEWADDAADLQRRPPVVTIMGHVDHGKTSLLDAIRSTDVVSGEAGGITQHIGAYQVTLKTGQKITFLDTPGHAAFTEMRARGANVTDIVVLVVAADDSIMPQTVEALSHARAAGVPIVVAINKVDKPGANPEKVKSELLSHGIVVESMGGDTLCVEVSAKQRTNLDKLEEAILLQSEILDLNVNPKRPAVGTVIEAKLQTGRGAVATVLVQKGTLRVGDIVVTGAESGRIRAMHDDHGKTIKEAAPGKPVEVIGLSAVPNAGDDFIVVENENKARDIAEFRMRKKRELLNLASKKSNLENMFSDIKTGARKELTMIIKGDVHGSVEAIAGTLAKVAGESTEVAVRIIHTGVGAVNESDITLANASKALVVGFNVRANPQARDLARRDGIDIRYYSVIYDIVDDVKGMLTGMLTPTLRENFLGIAEIRQVFNITKAGKIAGCYVTEGQVKRGAKVRLLRDDVVIHDGTLKTLKRFKDEVREVKEGFECGMAFENYEDIRVGDRIEAYEMQEIAREL